MQTGHQNSPPEAGGASAVWRVVFAGLLALIFLAPLKFGNPVATQASQYPPRNTAEWTVGLALEFVPLPVSCHAWLNQWFVCWVVGLFVLANWDTAIVGAWFRFHWRALKPSWPLALAWLAFAAASVVSLFSAVNIEGAHDTIWVFIAYCALAVVAGQIAATPRRLSLLVMTMACSALAVCWFGFMQEFFTMRTAPSWDQIYRVVSTQPEAQRVMQKYSDKRIFSTLVYPNTLGGFLAMASPLVFAALWQWRQRFTRGALIAAAILLAAILAAMLGLTRSNGGLAAAVVSLGATLLLWRAPCRKKCLIAAAAALLLAGFFAAAYGGRRLSGGWAAFSARLNYWRAAADLAAQRPLTGWGVGAFGDLYTRYIKTEETEGGRIPEEPRMAHNGLLQMAAEAGLAGAAGYAGIWFFALLGAARLYRRRRSENSSEASLWLAVFAGLGAWTTHELVDFDLYVPGVAAFAFVLAGLVLGAQWREGRLAAQEPAAKIPVARIPAIKIWTVRGGQTIVWGVLIAWLLRVSTANYHYIEAKELMFERQPALAVSAISQASKRAPHSAFYRSYAGDVQLALGDWEQAEKCFREATARARRRAGNYFNVAMARWRRLGMADETVLKELRRAVELYPAHPVYRAALSKAEKSVPKENAD